MLLEMRTVRPIELRSVSVTFQRKMARYHIAEYTNRQRFSDTACKTHIRRNKEGIRGHKTGYQQSNVSRRLEQPFLTPEGCCWRLRRDVSGLEDQCGGLEVRTGPSRLGQGGLPYRLPTSFQPESGRSKEVPKLI
jgi:hypothetical protein